MKSYHGSGFFIESGEIQRMGRGIHKGGIYMSTEYYPEFFNDVFGPVMQPGSSSHTAGPCRIAYIAYCLLGESPVFADFIMDPGSPLVSTFGLMNEDGGLLGGAMGFLPDDERLLRARSIAAEQGLEYHFTVAGMKESSHINSVKIVLRGAGGKTATVVGDSTAGGLIEIKSINNYPLRLKGDSHTILLFDPEHTLSERAVKTAEDLLAGVTGKGSVFKHGEGVVYYFNVCVLPDIREIRKALPGVRAELLKAVLPVITRPDKKGQLFDTLVKWRALAETGKAGLYEIALEYERNASGWDRNEILGYMEFIERTLYRQTHALYEENTEVDRNPFEPFYARQWEEYTRNGKLLSGSMNSEILKLVFAVNAKLPGIKIVPGPMGTGGGYLYSALYTVCRFRKLSRSDLLRGLFIAAGVGSISYTRSSPTGEVMGCAGECGVCCAMASAAIVEMCGGTPVQVENAASFALQSFIGTPCDPISGGFEHPCLSRIVKAALMSVVYADMSLAGFDAVLPYHEVFDVAAKAGERYAAEMVCHSYGACCTAAPTAKKQALKFNQWNREQGLKLEYR